MIQQFFKYKNARLIFKISTAKPNTVQVFYWELNINAVVLIPVTASIKFLNEYTIMQIQARV